MTAPTHQDSDQALSFMLLPLEHAFLRWSVVHRQWHESFSDCPVLAAFLAGWMCRCIGSSMPENPGHFRDSFRVGWREADIAIGIAGRRLDEIATDAPPGATVQTANGSLPLQQQSF